MKSHSKEYIIRGCVYKKNLGEMLTCNDSEIYGNTKSKLYTGLQWQPEPGPEWQPQPGPQGGPQPGPQPRAQAEAVAGIADIGTEYIVVQTKAE